MFQASLAGILLSAALASHYAIFKRIEEINSNIDKLLHIQLASESVPGHIDNVDYRMLSAVQDLEMIVARAVSRAIGESAHNQNSYPVTTEESVAGGTAFDSTNRNQPETELAEIEMRIANAIARREATQAELSEMLTGMADMSHEQRNAAATALTQAISNQQIIVHKPN